MAMAGASTDPREADKCIGRGKRMLAEQQYSAASDHFSEALCILAEVYGDLDYRCADAYKLYGNTLLVLAKQEASPLGADASAPEDEAGQAEDEAGPAEEGGEGEEDEEDLPTLQLAWENLECARLIYEKEIDRLTSLPRDTKAELKVAGLGLAEVYIDLGEYQLENGGLQDAVAEFAKSLKLRQQHLKCDDRRLAESHFLLGAALDHAEKFEEAIKVYLDAQGILNRFINSHKVNKAAVSKDLEGVLQELSHKIRDAQDQLARKQAKEKATANSKGPGGSKPREPASVTEGFGGPPPEFGKSSGGTKKREPQVLSGSLIKKKSRKNPVPN
eukprot:m.24143 g.24143  ORF g.24143 m.24143 type:complete len:331 (+) comp7580_c0_seq1:59-1051(+)